MIGSSSLAANWIFRLRNVGRRFANKSIFFESCDIPRGQITAIIGASGSGKSTLLHMLAGLTSAQLGCSGNERAIFEASLFEAGRPVCFDLLAGVPDQLRGRVGFVFQSAFLLQAVPASTNIALSPVSARILPQRDDIERIVDTLSIDRSFLQARSRYRSGGERQRIAVARAVARNPEIILADEPTASLDPHLSDEILKALHDWCRGDTQRSLVWVTHDISLAAKYADSIVVLYDGKLLPGRNWPQENPRDPNQLLEWMNGDVSLAPDRSIANVDELRVHSDDHQTTISAPVRTKRAQAAIVWVKVGLAQIFDGAACDNVPWLQRWASIPDLFSALGQIDRRQQQFWWRDVWSSFGAKSAVLRLSLLIVAFLYLWLSLNFLSQNLTASLESPTINPVVTSSRARITDAAIDDLQRQLMTKSSGALQIPDAFGRYELDSRRAALFVGAGTRVPDPEDCSRRRGQDESQYDVAGLDPAEPILSRIVLDSPKSTQASVQRLSSRSDGLWSVLVSQAALSRFKQIHKVSGDIEFVCLEVRGSWLTAQIVGIMREPPRGRHGTYEFVLSGTQWRDSGPARNRDLYESAALYFNSDPEISGQVVATGRQKVADMADLPDATLIQALVNEAAFERISAALDRAFLSKVIVGFLGLGSLFLVVLILLNFVASNLKANLKAICVLLAFGARYSAIATIEITRLLLVMVPTAVAAAAIALVLSFLPWFRGIAGGASTYELMLRLYWVFTIFAAGSVVLTLLATGGWLATIRRRSLSDQLKELD